jgi:hypothetical protein
MDGFEFLAWVLSGFLIISLVSSLVVAVVAWRVRKNSEKEFKGRKSRRWEGR